jgi:hypothetical protein
MTNQIRFCAFEGAQIAPSARAIGASPVTSTVDMARRRQMHGGFVVIDDQTRARDAGMVGAPVLAATPGP